jgi:predicted HTH transcriptional regulator
MFDKLMTKGKGFCHKMFEPKFIITNAINQSLSQIERLRGFLEEANLSKDWIKSMQKKALELALEGPFTLREYMETCPSFSKRTLQRELKHLQELELIEPSGNTVNRKYNLKNLM